MTLEHPPANLTSANQRRWLAIQQSQVNQDVLSTVLGTGRDILVGSPFIGAVFAFALISTLQRTGVFGDTEGNILKGVVATGGVLGGVGSAIKGLIP